MEFRVVLYCKENGEEPVGEYLSSLPIKLRKKTLRDITLLELGGPSLREPASKPLEDGIFELRSTFASDTSRILFFFSTSHSIVLTNGFMKKSGKLPRREIERAQKYRMDFIRRMGNETL